MSILPKLDPWVASSLLQKAVRRGEAELAAAAAAELYRHRGKGVWRRLVGIALEDVGIARPEVVADVLRLANDPSLRDVLGSDADLIRQSVVDLAAAPKDRSADYLFCAAVKLPAAAALTSEIVGLNLNRRRAVAGDVAEPLLRRAVAALSICTDDTLKIVRGTALNSYLAETTARMAGSLRDALSTEARKGGHVFSLMLPILWSAFISERTASKWVECAVPNSPNFNGVPLYAYDKHTRLGKLALKMLVRENSEVSQALSGLEGNKVEVAAVAAFYVDAAPVAQRATWSKSAELEQLGFEADMIGAGCPPTAMQLVFGAVARQRHHLDELRVDLCRQRDEGLCN